ncbi:HIT family protein [Massilia sp. S19_KUP03_FR1]|uniref:HIT family protein n=1 Tax=Massilia sp. S19_KUP03_FR1 TaxID=3025503 RepID=UPI002FCD7B4D
MTAQQGCELCLPQAAPVWTNGQFSVILVDDANYPGFCRVIWHDHIKEMSGLRGAERAALMDAVNQVELAQIEVLHPEKINLASLGNVVPHLHWHVIPRFLDDAHFPSPVWAGAVRATDPAILAARRALLPQLIAAIVRRLT